MKFKTIAEAFNHYRAATLEEIERRAAEIKGIIETDAEADVDALNVELSGLAQAKDNMQAGAQQRSAFNPIAGASMSFNPRASREATEGDVIASAEYRSAFFKNLLGQEMTELEKAAFNRATAEKRADAFSTSTNTAAVIPTQTMNAIVSKARTQGGLISVCRGFNVPANLSVPIGTPSGAANWHTEGAKVDREKPDIVNVIFGGNEIIKVFSISAKVRRMSVPAFESYLAEELNACTMATIANSLVNGTGSNQGMGVLSGVTWDALNSTTYTSTNGIVYRNIVTMISQLKRGYANGAVFAMNNTTLYKSIYGMLDDNKRPIFTPDPRNELIGRLIGFPVVVDDYLPDGTVLFGNFYYMGYNLPEGIAIESSTQSGFAHGLIDYRAMAIADTKPIIAEAFVKLSQAT